MHIETRKSFSLSRKSFLSSRRIALQSGWKHTQLDRKHFLCEIESQQKIQGKICEIRILKILHIHLAQCGLSIGIALTPKMMAKFS